MCREDSALPAHALGHKPVTRRWIFWQAIEEFPGGLESVQCLKCIHDLLTAILFADTLSSPIKQCMPMAGDSTT